MLTLSAHGAWEMVCAMDRLLFLNTLRIFLVWKMPKFSTFFWKEAYNSGRYYTDVFKACAGPLLLLQGL